MACDLTGTAENCVLGNVLGCTVPKEVEDLDPLVGLELTCHDTYFTVSWGVIALFPTQQIEVYYRSLTPIPDITLDDRTGDPLQDRTGDPLHSRLTLEDLGIEDIDSGFLSEDRDVGEVSSPTTLHKGMVYKVYVRVVTSTEADEWEILWAYMDEEKVIVTSNGEIVHYNSEILIY